MSLCGPVRFEWRESMNRAVCVAAALLALAGAAGAGQPDQAARDAAALKGEWELVSAESEGRPAPPGVYKPGTRVVVEGEGLYFTDALAKSNKSKFRLDPSTTPKSIDIGTEKSPGGVMKGIYALDGDALRLCL